MYLLIYENRKEVDEDLIDWNFKPSDSHEFLEVMKSVPSIPPTWLREDDYGFRPIDLSIARESVKGLPNAEMYCRLFDYMETHDAFIIISY